MRRYRYSVKAGCLYEVKGVTLRRALVSLYRLLVAKNKAPWADEYEIERELEFPDGGRRYWTLRPNHNGRLIWKRWTPDDVPEQVVQYWVERAQVAGEHQS